MFSSLKSSTHSFPGNNVLYQQQKCTVHTPCRKPYFYTTLPCEERVLSCNESVMDSILFQTRERDLRQGQSAAVKSQERVWAAFLSVKSPPLSSSTMLFLLQNHLAWSLSLSLAFSPISVFIVLTPFWPLPLSPSLSLSLSHSRPFIPFLPIHFGLPSVLLSLTPITLQYPWPWAEEGGEGDTRGNVIRSSVRLHANEWTKETRYVQLLQDPHCNFWRQFLLIDSVSTLVIKRAALLYSMPIRGFQWVPCNFSNEWPALHRYPQGFPGLIECIPHVHLLVDPSPPSLTCCSSSIVNTSPQVEP